MDILLAALDRRCPTRSAARIFAAVLLVVAVALAVGGVLADGITPVQVTLGALSGAFLFCAGYVLIAHGLSSDVAEKFNFRARMPLSRRRWMALWIVLAWILVLVLFGRYATSTVIIGALNVAVLLSVWRLGSMTEGERLYEAALAEAEDEVEWTAEDDWPTEEDEVVEYDEEITDWPEDSENNSFPTSEAR